MIRVAIVDDDPFVRAGLRAILSTAPDLDVVGDADDGAGVPDLVGAARPDVVVTDIRMPRVDGIEATARLTAAGGSPRVLVLTTFQLDAHVFAAIEAGASGFLLKDTPPERIVESIRAVSRGEPTLSPTVTARLIAAVTEAPDPGGSAARATARRRLEALTAREREVALAIGGGASNADIAGTLFMSVATVKSHVTSILAKTGAESRLQVAVLVRDAEL